MKTLTTVEIEEPLNWADFFPLYSFTWAVSVGNDYSAVASPQFELEKIGLNVDRDIIAFSVNRRQYQRTANLSDCITSATGGVFYYDVGEGLLYVHFEDHQTPYSFADGTVFIGFTLGFYKSTAFEGGFLTGGQVQGYDGRIISAPVLSSAIDDRLFLEQTFRSVNIKINNGDLKYKKFNVGLDDAGQIKRNKTGNYARVSFWQGEGTPDYSDVEDGFFYQGYIEQTAEGTEIDIKIRDYRKKLDVATPNRILTNSNWPDLKRSDTEYVLPQIWGTCYDVPVLCLNEDADPIPTNYRFMLAEGGKFIDGIDAVYIDGKKTDLTYASTSIQYDATDGFANILIPKAYFEDSDASTTKTYKGMDKVTVDVRGYRDSGGTLISTTMRIIREMIIDDYNVDYTSTFFDTTAWGALEADSRAAGYYIDKPKETYKKISDLQRNLPGTQFVIDLDRRYSWEDYRYSGSVDFKIKSDDILGSGFIPKIASDVTNVAGYVRIGHSRRWEEKELAFVEYDDNAAEALAKFGTERKEEFETFLSGTADLTDYRDDVLKVIGYSEDTFSITVSPQLEYNSSVITSAKAGQYFAVELNTENQTYFGWVVCQLTEMQFNADGNLDLSFIIYYPETNNFYNNFVYGTSTSIYGIIDTALYGESNYE